MPNQQHLDLLRQGVETWNQWRKEHADVEPDLSGADLSGADLHGAFLSGADLSYANLSEANLNGATLRQANLEWARLSGTTLNGTILANANLSHAHLAKVFLGSDDLSHANLKNADLREADLSYADLSYADLSYADLSGAYLSYADLSGANLYRAALAEASLRRANLSRANLREANLSGSILVETNLTHAILNNCEIYGLAAWNVHLEDTSQLSLIITPKDQPPITVDNLEIAQFIYLLLNNQKIRDVINTIGQKGVLILGRFSKERKPVLDALREKLRTLNFLPIVFDFEHPTERDFTETILTLAGLSCFIIADITNPKSTPLELQVTVPNYMIPFVPILQEGEQPFAMFVDLKGKYPWVLDILEYDTPSHLIEGLEEAVVKPALEKRAELLPKKVKQLQLRHIGDYLK